MSRSMQRSRWGNFSGADVVVGAGGGMGGPGTSCCWVNRCRKWWMTGWRSPRPVVSAKILRLSPSVHEAPKKNQLSRRHATAATNDRTTAAIAMPTDETDKCFREPLFTKRNCLLSYSSQWLDYKQTKPSKQNNYNQSIFGKLWRVKVARGPWL